MGKIVEREEREKERGEKICGKIRKTNCYWKLKFSNHFIMNMCFWLVILLHNLILCRFLFGFGVSVFLDLLVVEYEGKYKWIVFSKDRELFT